MTRELYYIGAPDGLAAVYVKDAIKGGKMYYAHSDHQGSIVALTDSIGVKVFQASYDAWGKQTVSLNTIGFYRGYTGHEHLPEFGLINMNGRMYDPVLGRFLSPDPYVQKPNNSQSYNRFSYCINNPLKYTDNNGYWFGWDDLAAAGVGAIVGYVSYGVNTGNWGAKAFAAAGVGAAVAWVGWNTMGAGSAALTHGAGSASSFGAGTSAVFGSAGGSYGTQFAALTYFNIQR